MKSNERLCSWAFVFALVLWMFASGVAGASTFEAGVMQFNFSAGNCLITLGSSPASDSWSSSSGGFGAASASAIAEGGTLRGLVIADSLGNQAFNNQIGACFRVVTVIDDVIISGPASPVSTQVSADLAGTIARILTAGGSLGTIGITDATVTGPSGPAAQFSTGSVPGTTVDTTLTTAAFSAPVNVAFAVTLTLFGQAVAIAARAPDLTAGTASISNDFGGTLNFTEAGPVFILPPGYTANSVDGEIVDNQFVGNVTSVPALGVSSIAVLVSLLLALGVRRHATGVG